MRAKLEHLVGPPHDRGDEYKSTFEYWFTGAVDGVSLGVHVSDWKAAQIRVAIEDHPDATLRDRVAAGPWELLTISPLAAFRDRFRFDDDEARRVYRSDGRTAFAERRCRTSRGANLGLRGLCLGARTAGGAALEAHGRTAGGAALEAR